jgi:Bacterial archaeo-eukaryotic release factor family 3
VRFLFTKVASILLPEERKSNEGNKNITMAGGVLMLQRKDKRITRDEYYGRPWRAPASDYWSLLMTITEPEGLSLEKLRGLASAAPPCISIVLLEREARDARIAFKDALAQVRAKLAASTYKRDIASLLDPLELAATNVIDSSKEPATFIFLRSPDVCESFRTRYRVGQSVAVVGEWFQLRPLLALASKHLEFYILALKLNDTRIFKCTDQFCEAARFPKNAGTEAAGFVPGAAQSSLRAEPVHDRDHPEDHLGRFYREIDRDVNALLKDEHPPLVVVGVEHEVALFHRLTTYPACVEPGIRGLPGHLSQNEMYQQSLELVRSVTTGPARRALEKFDKQIGTGHASADVHEIVPAASTGRVEFLFRSRTGPFPARSTAGPNSWIQPPCKRFATAATVKPYWRPACLPGALFARSSAMRQRVSNNA